MARRGPVNGQGATPHRTRSLAESHGGGRKGLVSGIRMLALDVDGTLAAWGDEVTSATRDALHRVTAVGVEVVIATGRRFRSTSRVIDRLGLDVAAVCLGGALVKESDQRTLHQTPLGPEAIRVLLSAMRDERMTLIGQRDSLVHGGADFVLDDAVPWGEPIARYVESNRDHAEARADMSDAPPEDVLVVGTYGPYASLERMASRLGVEHPGGFDSTLVPGPWADTFYLEVVAAEVSKWSALEHLGALRGVPSDAICAVGDQLNDLSMIHGSGLGVAMANGHDELKTAADWVCGRNDEDGLVEVVEHILAGG